MANQANVDVVDIVDPNIFTLVTDITLIDIYSRKADTNRRIVGTVFADATLARVNGLTEDTTVDRANDFLLFYDASAGVAKKVKIDVAVPSLDIDGLTAEATLDTANDYVAFYDDSATANRKVKISDLQAGFDINALTAETTVDTANDYVAMYDASATTQRKVKISDLPSTAFNISTLTAETSLDTIADFVAVYDASATAQRKVLLKDLAGPFEYDAGNGCFVTASAKGVTCAVISGGTATITVPKDCRVTRVALRVTSGEMVYSNGNYSDAFQIILSYSDVTPTVNTAYSTGLMSLPWVLDGTNQGSINSTTPLIFGSGVVQTSINSISLGKIAYVWNNIKGNYSAGAIIGFG